MADNMNNINTTMSANMTSSPTSNQTEQTSKVRRPSLIREGGLLAAHRNLDGIRSMTATGFTNSAARFEDTWGGVAFTETGFTENTKSERERRQGSVGSVEESLYLS